MDIESSCQSLSLTGEDHLARELKNARCICFYPSSGADLSNLDFFASGKRPREERLSDSEPADGGAPQMDGTEGDPDLFIHTDVNFYQEFASGKDLPSKEQGMYGACEVLEFRQAPSLIEPNLVHDNFAHTGRCFEYKLRIRGSKKIKTLIYCLCENEFLVSRIFLANGIHVPFIWSRNWAGGKTFGLWMANILDRLHTVKVYTDWLCIPGKRGEPRNRAVEEKYPELMVPSPVKLVRANGISWIDEGSHGWVEEFDVVPAM